eukprot:8498465-Alexandrium_andersonii.AAC.1
MFQYVCLDPRTIANVLIRRAGALWALVGGAFIAARGRASVAPGRPPQVPSRPRAPPGRARARVGLALPHARLRSLGLAGRAGLHGKRPGRGC